MTNKDGVLEGEGEVKRLTRTRERRECSVCGEPATKRHTYMLPNARRNPDSSGYRRDDISWCADEESYTCDECPAPSIDGYGSCSTFHAAQHEPYNHMLLEWVDRPATPQPDPVREELVEALDDIATTAQNASACGQDAQGLEAVFHKAVAALSKAKEGQ